MMVGFVELFNKKNKRVLVRVMLAIDYLVKKETWKFTAVELLY